MPRNKDAQIRAKESPNTTLQTLCQEKEISHKFEPKTHITLPYRNYGEKNQAKTHLTLP